MIGATVVGTHSEPASASEFAIWERVIYPTGPMSKETARLIVELEFKDDERQRMHEKTR